MVRDKKFIALTALGFSLVAVLLYWPASSGDWYLDDRPNILANLILQHFPLVLSRIFTERGVVLATFAIDRFIWGESPEAFRWVNVALHVVNSLLAMALSYRLTGSKRWPALLIGLLFLCHPVQSSAVSYIVQRMALMSAGFALAALLLADLYFASQAQGEVKQAWRCLFFAVLSGILSCLSKENTVVLPLAVLLLAWLRGQGKGLAPGWKPALLGFCLAPALPVLSQLWFMFSATTGKVSGVSAALYYVDTGKDFYDLLTDRNYLPFRYFLAQLEVFWVYLGLLLFPLRQALDYGWPIPDLLPRLLHVVTLLVLASLLLLGFKGRKRFPLTFFGLVWVVLFMLVESSVIPLDVIFEHRLYLALFGVLLILYEQLEHWCSARMVPILWLLIGVYSFLTWQRNLLWGDPVAFWQENNRVAAHSIRSRHFLVEELFLRQRYREAADLLRPLVARWKGGYYRLGTALYFAGDREEAMRAFALAERADASSAGSELFGAHRAIEEGRYADAEQLLARAEQKDVRTVFGQYLRGVLAERRGEMVPAVAAYQKAMALAQEQEVVLYNKTYAHWAEEGRNRLLAELRPWLEQERTRFASATEGVKSRMDWANQLFMLGLYKEAIAEYRKTLALAPGAWQVNYNLGIAYEKFGRRDLARECYRDGLRLAPDNPELLLNYAIALNDSRQTGEALALLEKLLVLTPGDGRVWIAYGTALKNMKETPRALQAFERAALLPGYKVRAKQEISQIQDEGRLIE